MTKDEYVLKLNEKKSDLKAICNYYRVNYEMVNDYIQELYLKIYKIEDIDKYCVGNEVNMKMVFEILKNMIFNNNKIKKNYEFDKIYNYETNIEDEDYFDLYQFVYDQAIKIEDWYHKKIILEYIDIQNEQRSSIYKLCKKYDVKYKYIQVIVHKFRIQCQNQLMLIKNQN